MDLVPEQKLAEIVNASDVVLCVYSGKDPNNKFALPQKMFQAMACGVPFIGNRNLPLMRSITEKYDCGLLCGEDPSSVLDAILTLYRNPVLRDRLSRNGRLAVEKTYNWERMSETIVQSYQSLDSCRVR